MALVASVMVIYVPLKLRRLYKLKISFRDQNVRSESLKDLRKSWQEVTDNIIQGITLQDFKRVFWALVLFVMSALISCGISLCKIFGIAV
jgi:hypothetical protein